VKSGWFKTDHDANFEQIEELGARVRSKSPMEKRVAGPDAEALLE